jgi:hypothetical protein
MEKKQSVGNRNLPIVDIPFRFGENCGKKVISRRNPLSF